MINNSTSQIDVARAILEHCQTVFIKATPRNMDAGTKSHIDKLKKLTDETIKKLKTPTLRLAFIGATSSGKSTVVNALVGQTIVPIEAGEMSAGMVQIYDYSPPVIRVDGVIQPSDLVKLKIAKPTMKGNEQLPFDFWNSFEGEVLVKVAYDKLQKVMHLYHEKKKTYSNIIAPQVEVWTRLLLAQNKQLLNLPQGVALEIVDLPGIKAVNDAANLQVLQNILKQAVLVIVLNYEDTSDDRLETLLQEVREVIKALQSTANTFFVLNKVDRWEKHDKPIPEKLEILRSKIAPILGMKKDEVVITPWRARLFRTVIHTIIVG